MGVPLFARMPDLCVLLDEEFRRSERRHADKQCVGCGAADRPGVACDKLGSKRRKTGADDGAVFVPITLDWLNREAVK